LRQRTRNLGQRARGFSLTAGLFEVGGENALSLFCVGSFEVR